MSSRLRTSTSAARPSSTSRTSSLNRRREPIRPVQTTVPSRTRRTSAPRLIRDGTVVWTGRVGSLRRFKDDVQEVEAGQECGIVLEGYADVKVGDILELFETKKVEQTLE